MDSRNSWRMPITFAMTEEMHRRLSQYISQETQGDAIVMTEEVYCMLLMHLHREQGRVIQVTAAHTQQQGQSLGQPYNLTANIDYVEPLVNNTSEHQTNVPDDPAMWYMPQTYAGDINNMVEPQAVGLTAARNKISENPSREPDILPDPEQGASASQEDRDNFFGFLHSPNPVRAVANNANPQINLSKEAIATGSQSPDDLDSLFNSPTRLRRALGLNEPLYEDLNNNAPQADVEDLDDYIPSDLPDEEFELLVQEKDHLLRLKKEKESKGSSTSRNDPRLANPVGVQLRKTPAHTSLFARKPDKGKGRAYLENTQYQVPQQLTVSSSLTDHVGVSNRNEVTAGILEPRNLCQTQAIEPQLRQRQPSYQRLSAIEMRQPTQGVSNTKQSTISSYPQNLGLGHAQSYNITKAVTPQKIQSEKDQEEEEDFEAQATAIVATQVPQIINGETIWPLSGGNFKCRAGKPGKRVESIETEQNAAQRTLLIAEYLRKKSYNRKAAAKTRRRRKEAGDTRTVAAASLQQNNLATNPFSLAPQSHKRPAPESNDKGDDSSVEKRPRYQ
jgi:hypothetical protein